MSRYLYILLFLLALLPGTVSAQSDEQTRLLEQADANYQIGRFEQVQEVLKKNLGTLEGTDRQRALRLLALCSLAQDDSEQTEYYARLLIELNNYYSNVDDPARFQELIEHLKAGRSMTITTASSMSENINEAPVPITIITAEMIENLGYNKDLSQILAAYVPGMAEVLADYDTSIAMHGAYALNQELVLVMENGHRLNNRSINSCSLDYSISTEKIDHIEVLRGPASSLYGNVALSAVVNIITKSQQGQHGIKVRYGYGSLNTHKLDLTFGTRFLDADFFAWGSLYRSDGQERGIDDVDRYMQHFLITPAAGQYAHVDAYHDKPCYDVGMTFRYKGFDVMFSRKNSRKIMQYTMSNGVYDYDRYRIFNGVKPGSNKESTHLEVGYNSIVGGVKLSVSAYGDWYENKYYDVVTPETPEEDKLPEEEWTYTHGMFNYYYQKEYALGGNLRAGTEYRLGGMTGNVLVGAQIEHYDCDDYYMGAGMKYDQFYGTSQPVAQLLRHENVLSFYGQGKHYWTPRLILNAGVRYDIKNRVNSDDITALSPRLALIYTPSEAFSVKLTYSKSFVDMAYNYRVSANNDTEYLPQYLTAVQLTAMGKLSALHLNYDVNLFYNQYKNLYFIHNETLKRENEGLYKTIGVEATVGYDYGRLSANMNFYWNKAVSVKSYYCGSDGKRVAAVPNMTSNLNVAYKLLRTPRHQVKVYGNAHYLGNTLVLANDFTKNPSGIEYYLDGRVIFDLGVKYSLGSRYHVTVDCENLLNTDKYLLGPAYDMYPYYQRGRTVMASVSVAL